MGVDDEFNIKALQEFPKAIYNIRLSKIVFVGYNDFLNYYTVYIGGGLNVCIATEDDIKEILESIEADDKFYMKEDS